MLEQIAGWVAPVATMVAAMMTAANLGARVTGWGFVIFTVGSIGWSLVGLSSGQNNLLATNAFLTLVNAIGIWRWLGRQTVYEDGGKSAVKASRHSAGPNLFAATGLGGMPVFDRTGVEIGKAVEAMVACKTGDLNYVVVASGGVGGIDEVLRAVPRADIRFSCEALNLTMSTRAFERLASLEDGKWPGEI